MQTRDYDLVDSLWDEIVAAHKELGLVSLLANLESKSSSDPIIPIIAESHPDLLFLLVWLSRKDTILWLTNLPDLSQFRFFPSRAQRQIFLTFFFYEVPY